MVIENTSVWQRDGYGGGCNGSSDGGGCRGEGSDSESNSDGRLYWRCYWLLVEVVEMIVDVCNEIYFWW